MENYYIGFFLLNLYIGEANKCFLSLITIDAAITGRHRDKLPSQAKDSREVAVNVATEQVYRYQIPHVSKSIASRIAILSRDSARVVIEAFKIAGKQEFVTSMTMMMTTIRRGRRTIRAAATFVAQRLTLFSIRPENSTREW